MIKFIQPTTPEVENYEKEFDTFEDVKDWVLEDKREGYGDVLAYGGRFDGLDPSDVRSLKNLTLEDALLHG